MCEKKNGSEIIYFRGDIVFNDVIKCIIVTDMFF